MATSTETPILLRIDGVEKSHNGHRVLQGVHLDVKAGEVVGLVGENGVGKSTLMSIIAGDYPSDAGEMFLGGEAYTALDHDHARTQGIRLIRQDFRIDPNLTLAQAIFRSGPMAGLPHEQLRRQAQHLLRDVGITLNPDARVGDMHRSELGLAEAARVLAEDAQLVIMDEVGATFNVREAQDLHFITTRLTRQGRSVIYISHRLREVISVADRIAVLVGGRVSKEFNADDITPDHIADAMLSQRYQESASREGHVRPEVLLEVDGLSAEPLEDVSLSVHRGEVLGLVGPRRSGVNQIVGAVAGEIPATWRTLTFDNKPVTIQTPADAAALGIAYFSDEADELGITESESIARSLMTGGWRDDLDFATEVAALREVIETLQQLRIRTKSLQAEVKTLSGGDKQKVALHQWMTEDRELIILNEPTRGLDVGARRRIFKTLAEHTAKGKSAILLTSNTTELLEWCDRIAMVRDGRIVRIAPAGDLDEDEIAIAMSARAAL
ncbi:sugar ABC transporter ATP-binding protein [Ammonicoccus fulvus]|uniref:Sugar ABC transporter ATP-binding protein n=1 Tax=Ammonicoccus fulvus TaxID=3138240 RepID=A0ABZ3FJ51_9ACTN